MPARAAAGAPRWIVTSRDDDRLTDYSADGVDLTLMLALTPAERLQLLQSHLNRILVIRELNAK